ASISRSMAAAVQAESAATCVDCRWNHTFVRSTENARAPSRNKPRASITNAIAWPDSSDLLTPIRFSFLFISFAPANKFGQYAIRPSAAALMVVRGHPKPKKATYGRSEEHTS